MSCANPYCGICKAPHAPSPSLQSAPAVELGFDPDQLVALFHSLDAHGQALAWSLMECAKRLQGKVG